MDNKDIDKLVAEAGGIDTFTDESALKLLKDRLKVSRGFYIWTDLGGAYMKRVPNESRFETDSWLRSEQPQIIHICQPLAFLRVAVRHGGKEESANLVGYAREKDGEVVCSRCGTVGHDLPMDQVCPKD